MGRLSSTLVVCYALAAGVHGESSEPSTTTTSRFMESGVPQRDPQLGHALFFVLGAGVLVLCTFCCANQCWSLVRMGCLVSKARTAVDRADLC